MALERNGAISWDVPRDERGLIPAQFLRQLKLAGAEAAARRARR